MFVIFAVLVGLVPVIPAVIYVLQNGKTSPSKSISRLVNGFNAFNFLVGMMAAGLGVVWFASPSFVYAAGLSQAATAVDPYARTRCGAFDRFGLHWRRDCGCGIRRGGSGRDR